MNIFTVLRSIYRRKKYMYVVRLAPIEVEQSGFSISPAHNYNDTSIYLHSVYISPQWLHWKSVKFEFIVLFE